ncbi:hypothetical protein UFOVP653_15 [uncultured Caudovirales phage]|uniref:Uncharacterized protein n=1 Tax=uncultured Caudovirales phage TaxID=2100421 RepID=A0A6J5N787_9CAUD|nr:hypothetical protein UFOVP653_15 [uncultured Caudovirales phage]
MDYGQEVAAMLEHLDSNRTPEELTYFMRCMSFAIAQASVYVNTMAQQDEVLEHIFAACRAEAKSAFAEKCGMSGAEFLEHCFKPEKFNG